MNYNIKFEVEGKIYFKKVTNVDEKEDAVNKIKKQYPNCKILKTYVSHNAAGEIL